MSIFGNIMEKIFHHPQARAATPAAPAAPPPAAAPVSAAAQAPAPVPSPAGASAPPVDVEAVLRAMAEMQGGGGDWRHSIVDLLKLLHLGSSLEARRELAGEMNVHAGADGSAVQNQALHQAVMRKLADNGGLVPDSFKA